jgi:hypothetical protein
VCSEPSSPTFFFSEGTFYPRPDVDAFVRVWYSKHLAVMKEPSLSCGPSPGPETYRFTWLRTFHHPIAVRVSWSHKGAELTSVELGGAGGYEPGGILRKAHRPLSTEAWSDLRNSVVSLKFWAMPTRLADDSSGADGAQWILEGRRGDEYHVVDRWSPQKGRYRKVGLQFLRLAGIVVPTSEVY